MASKIFLKMSVQSLPSGKSNGMANFHQDLHRDKDVLNIKKDELPDQNANDTKEKKLSALLFLTSAVFLAALVSKSPRVAILWMA